MRSLLPEELADVDLHEAYRHDPSEATVFVRCNMIESIDGAITIHGRSGALGGTADRRVFTVLRSLADVVLVGAGTARTEAYGPVRLDEQHRRRREQAGRSPVPPIAVVTRSGHLDWSAPFFTEAEQRPLVVTTQDCDEGARARAADVADIVVAGERDVDLRLALEELAARGHHSVLCEGGPGLNAQLVDQHLLDELCLTLSPTIVAGRGSRLLAGDELTEPLPLTLIHLLEEDGTFFLRFGLRSRNPQLGSPTAAGPVR